MDLARRLIFAVVYGRTGKRVYLEAASLFYGDLAGVGSRAGGVTVRRRVVVVCSMWGIGVAIGTDRELRLLQAHALTGVWCDESSFSWIRVRALVCECVDRVLCEEIDRGNADMTREANAPTEA